MQKSIYISILFLLTSLGLLGQTSNPFDLKWRSGSPAPTESATESKDTLLVAIPVGEASVDTLVSGVHDTSSLALGHVSDSSDSDSSSEVPESEYGTTAIDPTILNPESADLIPAEDSLAGSTADGSFKDKAELDGTLSGESSVSDSTGFALNERVTALPDQKAKTDRMITAPDNSAVNPVIRRTSPVGNIGTALFLILFGLALIVLIWAVNINRGFLKKIYRAALNENFSALLLREQRFASAQYLYYIVYAVFFLNGGLFLYLISRYASWDFGHRDTSMILFVAFLSLVYAVKHVVTRLLGETFQISKEMRHFNFNILLYNILAGIALMPVNLFLAFGPSGMRMPLVYVGLGIIALLYLMRQSRGIIMGYHLIVKNVFQFFVYLCAIEILPVLVLFKYFPN